MVLPKETSINQMTSEERFQLLVNGVTDYAIYMLSPTGEITNWNSGAERIKGYTADDVVGTHFSRFYTEEDRAAELPLQALETAAKIGRFEKEGWRVRKDGTRFWANVVIDAVRDAQGRTIGFAKITRDITERKNAEQALERARENLMQSQKMEAIGQLTGGVAHDFNNLLTVIVNCMDLLSVKLKDESDQRLLNNAQNAAERGARLTQQLLAFSRRQILRPDQFDINRLIIGFETILRRACPESINFSFSFSSTPTIAQLDVEQFEIALLNLVVNARDAMPNGGKLSIRTETVAFTENDQLDSLVAGDYVLVTIKDNGIGMPPEVLQHAIEPFYTTKEVGKGTGLGLSQVYGFTTQSGGTTIVNSKAGKGTTVFLYFPLVAEVQRAEVADVKTPAASADEALLPVSGKVLIVEDEPSVLEVAVEIFQSMDYQVMVANNGLDAIDILKHTRDIDLLFTDVVMPKGMSGVDLARFAQKLCPHLKVLLASGYPLQVLSKDYAAFKEFSFISKPFRRAQLIEKVHVLHG